MKRSDNYAGNQVRLFLGELKTGNHASKLKALQKFQSYIEQNKPEISDDNVEFLFTGVNNISGTTTTGLLNHCGLDSDKHPGQLKRICSPLISFVNWLINPAECGDEVYLATFTRLSAEELVKINFPKHILNQTETKLTLNLQSQTRSGSSDDAFALLQVLYTDHRTIDDEPDPIDIGYLLQNNKVCMDKFAAWMQRSNYEFVAEELANRGKKVTAKVIPRPSRWDDVQFRAIPLQEGEDVGFAEADEGPVAPPPILDPLRLRDVDLRQTQEIFATGGLEKRMLMNRRASDAGEAYQRSRARSIFNNSTSQMASLLLEDDDDDNEDDLNASFASNPQTEQSLSRMRSNNGRLLPSVIPSDKSFSVPLFLSLVHGGTTFDELKTGLDNLHSHLKEQSTRRVNLVRNHFGLFSQCADGLEWLRKFRQGRLNENDLTPVKDTNNSKTRQSISPFTTDNYTSNANNKSTNNTPMKAIPIDKFMENLKRAQGTLELAKVEAKNTLAPILERMKKVREIKSAEKVLKGMSTLLDYPRSMKIAFERGEHKDCVALYQRVKDIPSAMKLTRRIKNAANNVISDLKKASFTTLMTPSTDGNLLLKHIQILVDVEDNDKKIVFMSKILRLTFLRQLQEFVKQWKEVFDRFVSECVEAYDKGQEVNLMMHNDVGHSGNLFLNLNADSIDGNGVKQMSGSSNNILTIARKFYYNSNGSSNSGGNKNSSGLKRRPSHYSTNYNSNGNGSSVNGSPRAQYDRRPSSSSIASSSFLIARRPSHTSSNNNLMFGNNSVDFDDDLLDNPKVDFLLPNESSNNNSNSQNNIDFLLSDNASNNPDFVPPSSNLESLLVEFESSTGNNEGILRDYSEFFVMLTRRSFSDRVLDLVAKWFPCLFLLSCEALNTPLTASSNSSYHPQQNVGFNNKKAAFGTAGNSNNTSTCAAVGGNKSSNIGVTSPMRLLGLSLATCFESVRQVLNGMKPSFLANNNSGNDTGMSDVIQAIRDLEVELPRFLTTFNLTSSSLTVPIDGGAASTTTTTNATVRFNDILTSSYMFACALRPAMQLEEVLGEVFHLHEAMETALLTARLKLNKQNRNANNSNVSGGAMGFKPFSNTPFDINPATNYQQPPNIELEVTSPLSPFHDPFAILTALAKESETAVAQKILDKLLFTVHTSLETLLFETDTEVLYQTRLFSINNLEHLEQPKYLDNSWNLGLRSGNLGMNLGLLLGAGVELTVQEIDVLMTKGMDALRSVLHRLDWTSALIIDFFITRLLRMTLEKYRRKMLFIEDLGSLTPTDNNLSRNSLLGSSNSSNNLPITPPNRRSLMPLKRKQSMQQDHLTLISLEEELRQSASSIGFEADYSSLQSKNGAWMDCLRGLIRLRSYVLVNLVKKMKKVLSSPSSSSSDLVQQLSLDSFTYPLPTSANNTAGNKAEGSSSSSIMSRLFLTSTGTDAATAGKDSSAADAVNTNNVTVRNRNKDNKDNNNSSNRRLALESLASTNNLQTQQTTLTDKILSSCESSLDLNSSSSLGEFLRPLLQDLVKMECDVVDQYLQHRVKGLKGIIFASYTYLVELEVSSNKSDTGINSGNSSGSKGLPTHTSRIIMALHEEKKMLLTLLGNLSIDNNINYHLYKQANNNSLTDSEDEDSSHNNGSNSSSRNLYSTYLYQQLCRGLLEVYEELIRKLYSGSLGGVQSTTAAVVASNPTTSKLPENPFKAQATTTPSKTNSSQPVASSSSQLSNQPVRTTLQAVEEWEFIKAVLRPVFLDTQVVQKTVLTPAELQQLNAIAQKGQQSGTGTGFSLVTREEMLQAGQVLVILVQQ